MFFFGLSMGFYRSQAVALMPDFVKPHHRSKANAIINIMGGIGAIVAYTMGLALGKELQLTFIIASIIMVVALIVLFFTVNENEAYSYKLLLETEAKEGKVKAKKDKVGLINSFKDILNEEDKSTLFILLAIFAWFIGYQGLESFFSIYAATGPEWYINQTDAFASFMFNFVAIPFIIAAFPLSLLAFSNWEETVHPNWFDYYDFIYANWLFYSNPNGDYDSFSFVRYRMGFCKC